MSLSWRLLDSGITEAWNTVAAACPHVTFFQTKSWADLFCSTFRLWRPATVAMEFSDGNLMVLPLVRNSLFGSCESMIPHVYGGPMFLHPPDEEHLEAAQLVPTWYPDVTLLDNPFSPYKREQDGLARYRLYTQATDLTPGYAALWKQFRKGHKSDYKAAQKQGVTVAMATALHEVDAYYEIYQDSLRRWGKNANGFYPRRLFHNLFRMPEYGSGVKLLLARLDDKIIGGMVTLYHGEHAVSWHGSSHSAYISSHPESLLVISAIESACSEGFRWFDHMGPNDHLKGVRRFKEGFASQTVPYNAYYSTGSVKGMAFKRYRRFREKYLRRSPF